MGTIARSNLIAKWARPALIAYLIDQCLSVTVDLAQTLEFHRGLSIQDIDRLGIRSIPSYIANLVISDECLKAFGPEVLRASDLFFAIADDPWLLDIDEDHRDRGLLMPIMHKTHSYPIDLLLLRHLKDRRPFSIRVRADRKAAA